MLHITPRERQALHLMAQGKPLDEIGRVLEVGASAVESRVSALFARMGVSGTAEAVERARRRGLLYTEPDGAG